MKQKENIMDMSKPVLYDINTGDAIRNATSDEIVASLSAAEHDGGVGAINVDGRTCYVQE